MPAKRTQVASREYPSSTSNPVADVSQVWKKPNPGVCHPDFSSLEWKPIGKSASFMQSSGKQGITISLPFGDVTIEDIPEILQKFGGLAKVAAALRQPRENRRELSFRLCNSAEIPRLLTHPNVPTRIVTSNSFVLELDSLETSETLEERNSRARKELSAVQRLLQIQLKPLSPKYMGAVLTHMVDAIYVFDKLYDYEVCPAVVQKSDDVYSENQVVMSSIMQNILPSLPFSEETDPEKIFLYFPSTKFTNQTSFTCPDYIPSLYRDPLAAQEKVVHRMRQNFAQKMQWINGNRPVIPSEANPGAAKNLEGVPEEIVITAKQMLEEQPIWRRDQFYKVLKARVPGLLKEHQRFVLPGLTYRCTKGPWSRMWCLFGYDPLADRESRKYQTIDYRINVALLQKKRTIANKKHTFSESGNLLRKMLADVPKTANRSDSSRGLQQIIQLMQLAGVEPIQEILQDPDRVRDVCDIKEGHFVDGTMEEIRLEITKAIEREDPELIKLKGLVSRAQGLGFFKNTVLAEGSGPDDSGSDEEV